MINRLKAQFSKDSNKKIIQIAKWVILIILLYFAWRYFRWNEIARMLDQLPLRTLAIYLLVIFLSRILYASRWQLVGAWSLKGTRIPLTYYFQTNLLAEFVTIVMPTSLGGEVTRVLKLNARGSRTALSTASILVDRALGIAGMLVVSLTALALMGEQIQFNLPMLIPPQWAIPLIVVLMIMAAGALFFGLFWLRKPKNRKRLDRAWAMG